MADYKVDGLEANTSRVEKLVDRAKSHGGIVWFLPDEPRTVRYSVDSEDFDEYPGWDFVDAGVVKIIYKNIDENFDLTNKDLLDTITNVLSGRQTPEDAEVLTKYGSTIEMEKEIDSEPESEEEEKVEDDFVKLTKKGRIDGRSRAYKETVSRLRAKRKIKKQEEGE